MLSAHDMELQQQLSTRECKPDWQQSDLTWTHAIDRRIDHLEYFVESLELHLQVDRVIFCLHFNEHEQDMTYSLDCIFV